MLTALLLLTLTAADAPRAVRLAPEGAPTGAATGLAEARSLTAQARYEEAIVEYQRYLTMPERPTQERAQALLELGFLHTTLGDTTNGDARAMESLELDSKVTSAPGSPAKLNDFLTRMRKRFEARPVLQLAEGDGSAAPNVVNVNFADPEHSVQRVLIRYAEAKSGPFASVEMSCTASGCTGAIPTGTSSKGSLTFWYFLEALDAKQATIARSGSAENPLQLAIVDTRPWYQSPVVWAGAGVALVGIATVIYFLTPQQMTTSPQ